MTCFRAFLLAATISVAASGAGAQAPARPPASDSQPPTANRQPQAADRQPPTANRQLSASDSQSVKAKAGKAAVKKPIKTPVVRVDSEAKLDSIYNLRWPVKGPDPLPGSILPDKRIIAYYGNPMSKRMGVLGEYAPDQMLAMLAADVAHHDRPGVQADAQA